METLVLPTEDQLLQHQYWKSHSALGNPLLVPPKSYSPHSPLYRSAPDFSSPVPVAGSFSGIPNPRRKSPENAPRSMGNFKGGKFPRNSQNAGLKKGRRDEFPSSNIKILQRPVSREAAMSDLARITGLPLVEVYTRNGLPPPGENIKSKQESEMVESQPLSQRQVRKAPVKDDGELFCVKSFRGFLASEEKWAGPAFSNSPPPSSLPIPNFFLRRSEAAQVDIEAATRGLRKILNLNF